MLHNLIFLGTNGHNYINSKNTSNGGFILQIGGMQFHVDPGAGAILRCFQYDINPRNTLAVFVSNNSLKGSNDVNAIIEGMTYGGLDKRGVLIGGEGLIASCLTKKHSEYLERIINLKAGQKVGIEDVDVTATKVVSKDTNAMGFVFRLPRFKLGYTSDTSYFSGIEKEYEDCDILVINNFNPMGIKDEFSLNSDDTINLLKDVKPKLAVLTGFGIKMIKADPLYEAREISKKSNVQIIAAKDGLVLDLVSFSTTLKHI